jgi:hypothetical protein
VVGKEKKQQRSGRREWSFWTEVDEYSQCQQTTEHHHRGTDLAEHEQHAAHKAGRLVHADLHVRITDTEDSFGKQEMKSNRKG